MEDGRILPSYTSHDGYLMPKGFPVDGFVSGLKYDAQKSDFFVATYPKCGTTWTQHIVHLILNDGRPVPPEGRLNELFPHLEEVGADFVTERASVTKGHRLIKTHLPYGMTPQHPDAKYVVVVRNPKDCVVSFFHHTRGFVQHYDFAEGSFDDYFDLFIKGEVDFGDYFDHLRSWLDHKDDPNVLLITYERLREDTRDMVLTVAKFLDPSLPARLTANDDEILNRVLDHSSLDHMKKNPRRWCSDRPKDHTPFVRKGSVGGWDELVSPEQAARLDERMRNKFTKEELQWLGDRYWQ